MAELETEVTERQKQDAKAASNLSNKKDSLKAEQKKVNQLKKQLNSVSEEVGFVRVLIIKMGQLGQGVIS